MTLLRLNPVRIAALWAAIVLAGAVTGWFGYRDREAGMLARLVEDARRSAVAFDPADLAGLAAAGDDLPTPLYARIKARLQELAAIDPAVRFVYIFRADPAKGTVVFLADSAQRGAKDESLPGDVYAQAAASPGLQSILRTGLPATEGPLADDFGTWVTGYAAIGAPAAGVGPQHILGLDIDAGNWTSELWRAAFQNAFYVWIMLGLPLVALLVARRQGEQREVIRNLSEAMEQSQSALMIVDLESRIEYANRGLCQQIGYTRRELIGRRWQDFQVQQTPPETIAELVTTVRAGRTWEGEWFNRRKSGEVYPVRGLITPVKRRDGSTACFVASLDDITGQRRREAELREARDLAQAGDRAKGQFLATMSHEVRTPLNGIVGFSSLLLETPLTPEQRDYVQTIRMSTEALIQLTGDILDFARIESGKLKLDPLACDPRECVEDALDLMAAKAAEKKIELLHRIAADVPAAVLTDGGRLRQVLVNLVGNAVKFTEKGEVLVSVRRLLDPTPAPAPGPGTEEMCVLEFAVHDTGIGIAPEHQGKLFRAFTQVDESTTRRYGGTGLGLAISRNLVELMGGTIGVVSKAGEGATFTFTIRAPVAARTAPPPALPGLHLGLAVSSPALRRELAELVRSWQAVVTECERPEELVGGLWEIALVEVGDESARALAGQPPPAGLPPEKTVGLVPVSLPNETRTALRSHFRLLVNRPVHHAALFALLAGAQPKVVATPPAPRFGFRVLVAEDNPVNQRLVQRVLGNLGCTSVIVPNGRLALAELREHADRHDLLLLDLHMPEMDGLAALKEIRGGAAGPRAQTMWIVALTADAREQQRTEALADGLNDYLTKPLNVGELERALRRFRQDRLERKS